MIRSAASSSLPFSSRSFSCSPAASVNPQPRRRRRSILLFPYASPVCICHARRDVGERDCIRRTEQRKQQRGNSALFVTVACRQPTALSFLRWWHVPCYIAGTSRPSASPPGPVSGRLGAALRCGLRNGPLRRYAPARWRMYARPDWWGRANSASRGRRVSPGPRGGPVELSALCYAPASTRAHVRHSCLRRAAR